MGTIEKPDPKRAVISAGNIARAYLAGGFVPLGPYLMLVLLAIVAGVLILVAGKLFGF